jgi:hypothetical protein
MIYSIYQVRKIVKKEANHGDFRYSPTGRVGKGKMAQLYKGYETSGPKESHGGGSPPTVGTFL